MYMFHLMAQYASATYIDLADLRHKQLRLEIGLLSDQLSELNDNVEALMAKGQCVYGSFSIFLLASPSFLTFSTIGMPVVQRTYVLYADITQYRCLVYFQRKSGCPTKRTASCQR